MNRHPNCGRRPGRRGLAPLEFVIGLPLLLFLMALMVNFGVVSSWKVRGLVAARHQVWSSRHTRSRLRPPWITAWEQPSSSNAGGTADMTDLDLPELQHPVARGQFLPFGTEVDWDLLNPERGPRAGTASRKADFPSLSSRLGQYSLKARTDLLDNTWQYRQTKVPHNWHRRMPAIYALRQSGTAQNLQQAYVQAAMTFLASPTRGDRSPLDREEDFIYYRLLVGWSDRADNFHPPRGRLSFCSLDHTVARASVDQVIDQIQGKGNGVPSVAVHMTRAFIAFYKSVIRELERQIEDLEALLDAEPSPIASDIAAIKARIADLEAEIPGLEAKIELLEDFD